MSDDLKYELIPTAFLSPTNEPLFQIRALRDIVSDYYFVDTKETLIKKGTLGGFVSSDNNLSQFDNSWIFPNGIIFGQGYIGHYCRLYSGLIGNKAHFLGTLGIKLPPGDQILHGFYEGYGLIKRFKDLEKYDQSHLRKQSFGPQGP